VWERDLAALDQATALAARGPEAPGRLTRVREPVVQVQEVATLLGPVAAEEWVETHALPENPALRDQAPVGR
jgi:hypothetical protein